MKLLNMIEEHYSEAKKFYINPKKLNMTWKHNELSVNIVSIRNYI